MSESNFRGKVVLITGAACGIGAATAKKFAELGAILSLLDLQPDALDEIVQQCHTIGQRFQNPKPYFLVGDVTNDEVRKQYVDDTINQFGRIDILFNNAGILLETSILSTPMYVVDKLFNVHVRAVYDMCRLSAHHLIKTKGCIINVASVAAHVVSGNHTAYSVAKAAIKQMTKCLADEFGSHQVRVVAVSPGPIKTGILASVSQDSEETFRLFGNLTVLKRCGLPEEIANTVAFLASDEANFITGTDVIVDGGFLARHLIEPIQI